MIAATARHTRWAPYFFLAPFLLIFATFTVYPIFQSVVLSTQHTWGPGATRNVGLDNYRTLVADPLFWKALQNTAFFALGSLLTQMPAALGLAMLLNQKSLRARGVYRLIFFSPALMGFVFVALLVGLVFTKRTGLVNVFLHDVTNSFHWLASYIHVNTPVFDLDYPWLEDHVRPTMVLAALWMYTGFNMVYFLAALQNVDLELLEAAQVDGAGPWRRFWHITLPSIRPVASFIALLSIMGSFQLYELPYIIFANSNNENGPRDSGLTIVMYLMKTGFAKGNLGYACAIGWVLAILLVAFGAFERFLNRKEDV